MLDRRQFLRFGAASLAVAAARGAGAQSAPRSAGTLDARAFGAVFDGQTDDHAALTRALAASASSGQELHLPRGTALLSRRLLLPPGVTVVGEGAGRTVLLPGPGLPLAEAAVDALAPGPGRAAGIRIAGLMLDGRNRRYPRFVPARLRPDRAPIPLPDQDYLTKGYLLRLFGLDEPVIEDVEFTRHESITLAVLGCRGAVVRGCAFRRCGKGDDTSSALFISDAGQRRVVTAVLREGGESVVLGIDAPAPMFQPGMPLLVSGPRPGGGFVEGRYTVARTAREQLVLRESSCPELAGFRFDGRAVVATPNWRRCEGFTIADNVFEDLERIAIHLSGLGGGVAEGNRIARVGEAGIYLIRAAGVVVQNNTIDGVRVTDIVGSGIELNFCADCKLLGNRVANSETNALNIYCAWNTGIENNTLRNAFARADLRYPAAPYVQGHCEGILDCVRNRTNEALPPLRRIPVLLHAGPSYPSSARLAGNRVADDRAPPPAAAAVALRRTVGAAPFGRVVAECNDFTGLRGADARRLVEVQPGAIRPENLVVRGNRAG